MPEIDIIKSPDESGNISVTTDEDGSTTTTSVVKTTEDDGSITTTTKIMKTIVIEGGDVTANGITEGTCSSVLVME